MQKCAIMQLINTNHAVLSTIVGNHTVPPTGPTGLDVQIHRLVEDNMPWNQAESVRRRGPCPCRGTAAEPAAAVSCDQPDWREPGRGLSSHFVLRAHPVPPWTGTEHVMVIYLRPAQHT